MRENKFVNSNNISFAPQYENPSILNPQIFTTEKNFGDNHANARFYNTGRPGSNYGRPPLNQNIQNQNPIQGPYINVVPPNQNKTPIQIIDQNVNAQNYNSQSPFKPLSRPLSSNPDYIVDRSSPPIYPRHYIEQHMSVSRSLLNNFPLDYSLKQNIEKLGGIEDTIGSKFKENLMK